MASVFIAPFVAGGEPLTEFVPAPRRFPLGPIHRSRPSLPAVRFLRSPIPGGSAHPSPAGVHVLQFRRSRGPSVGGEPNHALQRTGTVWLVFSACRALPRRCLSLSSAFVRPSSALCLCWRAARVGSPFARVTLLRVRLAPCRRFAYSGTSHATFTLCRRQRPSFPADRSRRLSATVARRGLTTRSSEQRLAVGSVPCLHVLLRQPLSLSLRSLGRHAFMTDPSTSSPSSVGFLPAMPRQEQDTLSASGLLVQLPRRSAVQRLTTIGVGRADHGRRLLADAHHHQACSPGPNGEHAIPLLPHLRATCTDQVTDQLPRRSKPPTGTSERPRFYALQFEQAVAVKGIFSASLRACFRPACR